MTNDKLRSQNPRIIFTFIINTYNLYFLTYFFFLQNGTAAVKDIRFPVFG